MKFGVSYISYVNSAFRQGVTNHSLTTLAATDTEGLFPYLFVFYKASDLLNYDTFLDSLTSKFVTHLVRDEANHGGVNNILRASVENILLQAPDVTHLVFLYDDFIFNPNWLKQLVGVIERHPDARAWSVYRSSYTRHHRIVDGDGVDVRMTMHDGIGCITKEEWKLLDNEVTVRAGDTTVPNTHELGGGCSLDVFHAYALPGSRWATSRDYWQNLGIHPGLGRQDQAIDFVGEE